MRFGSVKTHFTLNQVGVVFKYPGREMRKLGYGKAWAMNAEFVWTGGRYCRNTTAAVTITSSAILLIVRRSRNSSQFLELPVDSTVSDSPTHCTSSF